VLGCFSSLLIDPNRGEDDPTLIMKLSDGMVIPANHPLTPKNASAVSTCFTALSRCRLDRDRRNLAQVRQSAAGDFDPFLYPCMERRSQTLACRRFVGH
jgi:hypothetical protein